MSDELNDFEAADIEILTDYLPKLIRLAKKNMNSQLQQKVEADDVGQTVMRTVLRRVKEGKIKIEQSAGFWKLLVAITLCKVRKKARHFDAAKRSSQLEQPMVMDPIDYRTLSEPSNEEAVEFADLLSSLNGRLNKTESAILIAKLEEKTHHEIASELGISTRKISRELVKIAEVMRAMRDEE